MKRLLVHSFVFVLFLAVFTCPVHSQNVSELNKLGIDAYNKGALYAASYFLYADYLNRQDDFNDLELTAFLLSSIEEYSAADSLLQIVMEKKNIDELCDSLQFFYYSSHAIIAHNAFDNISALNDLARIPLSYENYVYELNASCYEGIGLYDKALQAYSLISPDEYPDRTACLIGNCYREMGHYSEAIDSYNKAIKSDPYWAFPYYGIGWSYELSGDDENALEYYNKGLEVDQSFAYLFLKRGEMYLKKGKKELADKDFNAVLRLDKQLEDGTCRQYALLLLGRNNDALNWMNRLIEYQPNNPGHYYDKACLCCRMGLLREAVEAIGLAFEKGYRKFSHLDADDDIDPIRSDSEYLTLYKKYQAKYMEELEQLKDI